MKRIFYIFALVAATCGYAQENAPQMKDDYCWGKLPGYPEHYCTCRNSSQAFSFPLITQVTDTMWFSSTVDDMKQGLSAYWFSDCSITFEVYAFCSSKTPTITMTVGANQMREMDIATINRKLDEMGDMAELLSQALTPRIKVYPNGGTGTVYCYPYNHPCGVPDKGKVLNQLSLFWLDFLGVKNHLETANVDEYPAALQSAKEDLRGRSMLVRKVDMFPAECIVRGYLTGRTNIL